jgi:hypothetical protein
MRFYSIKKGIDGMVWFFMIVVVFQYCFYKYMPLTHWFKYHDLYPLQQEFERDERIKFVSVADIYKPVHMEWTDILRCDYGKGFEYSSVYVSSAVYTEPKERQNEPAWVYNGHPVERPTTCYLDSSACIKLPFVGERCQTGVTQTFKLK